MQSNEKQTCEFFTPFSSALAQAIEERKWNHYILFARTEAQLAAIELKPQLKLESQLKLASRDICVVFVASRLFFGDLPPHPAIC